MENPDFIRLAVALGLGLLVGAQRQRVHREGAGVRTITLITVTGAVASMLAAEFGGAVLAATLVAVAALLVAARFRRSPDPKAPRGITTELAGLLMFGVGAVVAQGAIVAGVVLGGSVAVLLHWKRPLHALVARLGEAETEAVARLVLIALVILPVMPDEAMGPFDVLNPFRIWLMVVLIAGISLVAWLVGKAVGPRRGAVAAGLLGGLVSSTATAVSQARWSRKEAGALPFAAIGVTLSSAVVIGRVLVEISIAAPGFLAAAALPIGLLGVFLALVGAGYVAAFWRKPVSAKADAPPSDLRAPVAFALLYAVVLVAGAFVREHGTAAGLYGIAIGSGLTDVDSITLTTSELVRGAGLDPGTGWRLIVTAILSNLAFKCAAVAVLGSRALFRALLPAVLLSFAGGAALLAFGPS